MGRIVCLCALAVTVWAVSAASQDVPLSKNFIDVKKGTWTGVILERSCFQKLGGQKAGAVEHNACALDCLKKGQPLGILTDDDGFMTIAGEMSKDKFAKLTQYIGKRVEVTGTSAQPTGNYIPRQIEITKIAAAKN